MAKKINKPKVRKIVRKAGHRGGANYLSVSKQRPISADWINEFLAGLRTLHVTSSNVSSAAYDPDAKEMTITYGDGAYVYSNVSLEEAIAFTRATSKGIFVWNVFRVRGSKTAHRKPFRRL